MHRRSWRVCKFRIRKRDEARDLYAADKGGWDAVHCPLGNLPRAVQRYDLPFRILGGASPHLSGKHRHRKPQEKEQMNHGFHASEGLAYKSANRIMSPFCQLPNATSSTRTGRGLQAAEAVHRVCGDPDLVADLNHGIVIDHFGY